MGCVLVHHDEAVARLRHDVVFMDLRARRAERAVEQVRRRRALDADVGGRRADIERGLIALCESRRTI